MSHIIHTALSFALCEKKAGIWTWEKAQPETSKLAIKCTYLLMTSVAYDRGWKVAGQVLMCHCPAH